MELTRELVNNLHSGEIDLFLVVAFQLLYIYILFGLNDLMVDKITSIYFAGESC